MQKMPVRHLHVGDYVRTADTLATRVHMVRRLKGELTLHFATGEVWPVTADQVVWMADNRDNVPTLYDFHPDTLALAA